MAKERFTMYHGKIWGIEPSEYAQKNDRLDFRTLSQLVGDSILNNEILQKTNGIGFWDDVNGGFYYDDDDEYPKEVFQWYIISEQGAGILMTYTDEIVMFNAELDMYLWGITHWGTAWDYVLTDIKLSEMEVIG